MKPSNYNCMTKFCLVVRYIAENTFLVYYHVKGL